MNNKKGHYLFCLNKRYYIYDYVAGLLIEVTETLYNTLIKYDSNQENSPAEQEIISTFLANGLLQPILDISSDSTNSSEQNIAYLSFAPTYKCNFRCAYCFGEHGDKYQGEYREFTVESLKQILDYFFQVAFPDAKKYRIDFVSGGEPLLGFPIIKAAIEYFEQYSFSTGKQISVWLCTNGSLLTNEIIEYLSLHNVSIGISIDGRKELNDATRFDINGKGTYDKICKGIALIQNNKIANKRFKTLWGLCTATNENCDFVDILYHMKELGFQNVQIRLIRSEKNYEIEKIQHQYSRLAQMLAEDYAKGNLEYFKMILNDNDQFGKVLKRIMLDQLLIRRCNAGNNKITICPDGTIYPCDSLVGLSNCILGNTDISFRNRAYQEITVDRIQKCASCDIKYLCGGDCYYNSYMKTGDLFSPDTEFCRIQQHIIHLAIVLRYTMQMTNDNLYQTFLREVKKRNDYSELFG